MKWVLRIGFLLCVVSLGLFFGLRNYLRQSLRVEAQPGLAIFDSLEYRVLFERLSRTREIVTPTRELDGNAADLLLRLGSSSGANDQDDRAVETLIRAGRMSRCNFYPDVIPISSDLLGTEVPTLFGISQLSALAFERADALVAKGKADEAMSIDLSLLSVADHLYRSQPVIGAAIGLELMEDAALHLIDLGGLAEGDGLASIADAANRMRAVFPQVVQYAWVLVLDDHGLFHVRALTLDRNTPPCVLLQIAISAATLHLQHVSGVILGPMPTQSEALEILEQSRYPSVVQFNKAAKSYLGMWIGRRFSAMEEAGHIP